VKKKVTPITDKGDVLGIESLGEGRRKEEGGRRKEEEGRRKEEGGRRKEEGGRRKEEGGRKKEEGERRKEEGGKEQYHKEPIVPKSTHQGHHAPSTSGPALKTHQPVPYNKKRNNIP
jgi:ATP-dependent RNA helicase DHX57